MSKAFTKETDDTDELEEPEALPSGVKNYMTPFGFATLQAELRQLQREERPKVVEVVSWAAGNGDRSENGAPPVHPCLRVAYSRLGWSLNGRRPSCSPAR